ncbi:unnamed protein product, partial [Effrenium voratum]
TEVGLGSAEQLMEQADVGDWPSVAYQLAHERAAVGAAALRRRLRAKDSRARQLLRRASGAVLVLMPYDLCVAYTKTGKLPGSGENAADLLVEQPRWLQPRPKKDQRFLIAGDAECPRCRREEAPSCAHRRGGKLPEGWYTVVQYPLGDSPHLLRKAVLRRKDWRCADLEAPKERFYALWHVEWDDVKGEVCESLADAERKFEQFREVYKVLGRKLSVTGVLVDGGFRELRFVGAREASVMNKFRDWWQRHQAAAAVARDVGETLLCKAAKAAQWDLVLWMLQQSEEDSMSLANQLEAEWQGVWEEHFWYSKLRSVQELRELLDSIAQEGMYLSRPWLRGGAVVVPKGAELVSPQLAMLKEALALEQQAPLALEALRFELQADELAFQFHLVQTRQRSTCVGCICLFGTLTTVQAIWASLVIAERDLYTGESLHCFTVWVFSVLSALLCLCSLKWGLSAARLEPLWAFLVAGYGLLLATRWHMKLEYCPSNATLLVLLVVCAYAALPLRFWVASVASFVPVVAMLVSMAFTAVGDLADLCYGLCLLGFLLQIFWDCEHEQRQIVLQESIRSLGPQPTAWVVPGLKEPTSPVESRRLGSFRPKASDKVAVLRIKHDLRIEEVGFREKDFFGEDVSGKELLNFFKGEDRTAVAQLEGHPSVTAACELASGRRLVCRIVASGVVEPKWLAVFCRAEHVAESAKQRKTTESSTQTISVEQVERRALRGNSAPNTVGSPKNQVPDGQQSCPTTTFGRAGYGDGEAKPRLPQRSASMHSTDEVRMRQNTSEANLSEA